MFKKYYCIKQHDITDCGAACLATISKQHGYKTSITKIREVAGTDKQGGALLHYVVIHKITKKQLIIAEPAVGMVKFKPEEFFGEVKENDNIPPKYQWSGVLILLAPTTSFTKGDETKGLFQRFFHLLLPQRKLLINVFIASLIYTLLGIIGAFYFKVLLDEVLPLGLKKTLHILSIGVILLNLFKLLLNAIRSHLLLYLSQKLDIALLLGYYRHILELPMSFFGTRKVGEIVSRFNDASNVRDAISGATLTIMIDTLMVFVGGWILYSQNAYMFVVTLIIVIFYLIIVWSFNKWYNKLNREQMEDNAQLTSYLVESLNGIQTVKAYNAERKANQETETKFIKLLKSIFKISWVSNLQGSLKGFVELTGGIVILWVGGYNVIKGNMTIGQLIAFNSLLAYFLDPVKNIINLQPMMQTAIVAADRLGEILDLEPEKTENENKKLDLQSLKGDIHIKDVSFRYGTRKLVLEDINMYIKQGQKVAFVGESGSGKTTLAKLLLNLYQTEQGDILINDNNIKDMLIYFKLNIHLDCINLVAWNKIK
ncbi:MAG TPA: peptidase domain-containing ABC transporter [Clostridiales bacterium]|nr:peptidase domain-containing ABC transporter [Clostridiales bacterium]